MSLRAKLVLTHTAVVVLAIVLVVIVANGVLNRYFAALAADQAREQGQIIAEPLAECYSDNGGWPRRLVRCAVSEGGPGNRALLPLLRGKNRRVLVADTANRIFFDSSDLRGGQRLSKAEQTVAVPIVVAGATVGSVVVVPNVGQFGAAEDRFLKVVRRSVLIAGLGAAVVALLIGSVLAGGVTRPLRALTVAAHQLASGDRSAQVAVASADDEVGELSRAFNTMSNELRRSEDDRRHMVADIAHELRTPLSVLQLELESIEDGITQATPQVVASLNEEVGLLSRLIDDLRTLSLADAGQLSLNPEAIAVSDLLARVVGRMQRAASDKGIRLTADAAPNLPPIQADSSRAQQIIGNLLQNALRYTPSGGQVTVRAAQQGREVVITVQDSGPGFSPAEAAQLFERFYRTDKARARETGGSGLGLAIVRGLVQAMGGRVWATSVPGSGAVFHVALPVASS
jgi:signal transduction histidine kinase